jgi:membrane associated rhomboid family serine protease
MFPLYDLNPHRRFPWVTVFLIVINVGILASQGIEPSQDVVYEYGFIPLRVSKAGSGKPVVVRTWQANRLGVPVPGQLKEFRDDPPQVYLTFLTTMFLHGGWLHLLTNMWMLWIFGNNVEDRLGRFMFLCYYLLGGMIGSVGQWAYDPMSDMPVIGASGAVAAVLGGYAITYPKAKVRTLIFVGIPWVVDFPALLWLGIWFVTQLAAGWWMMHGGEGPQVAYWAHVGGFVAGIVLMPVLALGASPADADWKREAQELFRFDDLRSRVE